MWNSLISNNCNTYLIDGPTRILIDPGHIRLFDHVQKGFEELGMKIEDIGLVICTHAHPDHIEAVQLFKDTQALIAFHEKEWQFIKTMDSYLNSSFGINKDSLTPDFFLKEGELFIQGLKLKIFFTPGHSPGSISIYWPEQKALFPGDLIFKEGIGRTDLPGGDSRLLKESIKRISELEIEELLPGHGEIIPNRDEVEANFDFIEQFWFPQI
ncbi:MAG: MBL fold metallo-hydrolase [Deltaproteobacteria bacterium]|nr:MAG: MBL fold metallo-hydrolase [Deltaproteobacteria bacterium]